MFDHFQRSKWNLWEALNVLKTRLCVHEFADALHAFAEGEIDLQGVHDRFDALLRETEPPKIKYEESQIPLKTKHMLEQKKIYNEELAKMRLMKIPVKHSKYRKGK